MVKIDDQKISIDDIEYDLQDLTDKARANLSSLQFVDSQIQQLRNELAVADTAKIGYLNALRAELSKLESAN